MMRLYYAPLSPFARKTRVLVEEAGLADRVETVEVNGTPLDPGTIPVAQNPLGKLPVLERPDGPSIYDSRVICRYLATVAGGGLYPAEPRLWDTLTLEATADGIADAALLMVYEVRMRPETLRSSEWVEAQWSKVTRALDAIEARWLPHLAGPVDAAQIALGCTLGYLDYRHGARTWRDGRPALAAWEARFAERPSMRTTAPA
jgi:glutathione S-transferase